MFVKSKIPKRWAYFAETATYIKNKGYEVDTVDCLDPKISHGEVLRLIAKNKYSVIVLLARRETARAIMSVSKTIKEMLPSAKILVYGDMANYFPNFFKSDFIDAIISNGDWECGFDDYLEYCQGKIGAADLRGVSCRENGVWTELKKGRLCDVQNWTFPDIKTPGFINKELYYSINDGELTISVSRGCPFNCTFCPAVITFGEMDRRIPVSRVVEYIKDNIGGFKSLKFFSPTFTFDKKWVKELCLAMINEKCVVPWSCTSRPDCLDDDELLELMAEAGCFKIALGVETLDRKSNGGLKKFRNLDDYIGLVEKVIRKLVSLKINPKILMMLGLNGQTGENLQESFDLLKSFGATDIRAASYSPRQLLLPKDRDGSLTVDEIEKMDKMTYQHIELPGVDRAQYLQLIYNTQDYNNILKDEKSEQ